MYYPNAHKGIKKLFIGEILVIIAAILALVPTVLKPFTFDWVPDLLKNTIFPIFTGVFSIFAFIAIIAAFVLQLIGLLQGGKDSDYIRLGFWITIFIIVFSVASQIMKSALPQFSLAYAFVDGFVDILSTMVMVYVVLGIAQLAASLNNYRLVSLCKIVMWLIIALFALSIIIAVTAHFFTSSNVMIGFNIGLSIFAALIELLVAILYFFLLLKATIALRK